MNTRDVYRLTYTVIVMLKRECVCMEVRFTRVSEQPFLPKGMASGRVSDS